MAWLALCLQMLAYLPEPTLLPAVLRGQGGQAEGGGEELHLDGGGEDVEVGAKAGGRASLLTSLSSRRGAGDGLLAAATGLDTRCSRAPRTGLVPTPSAAVSRCPQQMETMGRCRGGKGGQVRFAWESKPESYTRVEQNKAISQICSMLVLKSTIENIKSI